MKYCHHCGTQLDDNTKFCSRCGKSTTGEPKTSAQGASASQAKTDEDIVKTLSDRLQISGIIWIIIGAIQIIIGLCGTIIPIIVGVLNIISAVNDLKNSKRILTDPTGIVAAYEPITMPIVVLAYNLLVGGVIGVIGSIYHLLCIREHVVKNKDKFLELENK